MQSGGALARAWLCVSCISVADFTLILACAENLDRASKTVDIARLILAI